MKHAACLVLCLAALACGKDSPTAPTPPQTPTKIIRLSGSLNWGTVQINTEPPDGQFTIHNDGNANLQVTSIGGPCGIPTLSVIGSTNFAIAPGGSLPIVVRYRPTVAGSCSGTVSVTSDATSGGNTLPVTATAVNPPRPVFSRTGAGDSVFDMPVDVARVRIIGIYNGNSSNFIVRIGGRLIVNELIGDAWGSRRYDGILLTGGGGVTAITNSSGVNWSFEEIR